MMFKVVIFTVVYLIMGIAAVIWGSDTDQPFSRRARMFGIGLLIVPSCGLILSVAGSILRWLGDFMLSPLIYLFQEIF